MYNSSYNQSFRKNSPNENEAQKIILKKWNIYTLVDVLIEKAQLEDYSLEDTLKSLMPKLISEIDCEAIFIKTKDETLKMKTFNALKKGYNSIPADMKEIEEYAHKREIYINKEIGTLIAMRIDVAQQYFGIIGIFFDKQLDNDYIDEKIEMLHTAIEVIDNYLSMIYNASRKQKSLEKLGEAISDKILIRGLNKAVSELYKEIDFDKFIILYWKDINYSPIKYKYEDHIPLSYMVFSKDKLITSSEEEGNSELHKLLLNESENLLKGEGEISKKLLNKLNLTKYVEMSLIYGKNTEQLVGKIIIKKKNKNFNTTQRDILKSFSTLLRQRIVDFNKEYQSLSMYFSPAIVNKLLSEEDYQKKYLEPREQHIAILYTDIAYFTKISETLLKEPKIIGEFIDEWSYRSVQIIWENGGVFDKMPGDCIIGLFGPPFYEYDPKELCVRAIKTAIEINRWADEMSKSKKFDFLRKSQIIPGLGVTSGINYCPAFVGRFGPNRNFTCF
ncbi:MAG: adenylate/guanylate cyclase domain-containing protein, partial [Spirochaetota bacterium]